MALSAATSQRAQTLERAFGARSGASGASNQPVGLVLAPMVRAGTLPLRLLAQFYGARATWSEELIAKKLHKCERVVNAELGTVDFVLPSRSETAPVVYQTCPFERGVNILQIGASNADDAVRAVRPFVQDVAGVDLNCGCPQHFSLSGGMGAALLSKPAATAEIIGALRKEVPADLTVSCKIRLLDSVQETVSFIKQLEGAGVDAITIHARRVPERPRDKARWDELQDVIDNVSVPVIVNGDVFLRSDGDKIVEQAPGASGVMIARGAIADVSSAFSLGSCSIPAVIEAYTNVASFCAPNFSNCKWFASQVIRYRNDDDRFPFPRKVLNERVARAKSIEELREAFGILPSGVSPMMFWSDLSRDNAADWKEAIRRACYPPEAEGVTIDHDDKRQKCDA